MVVVQTALANPLIIKTYDQRTEGAIERIEDVFTETNRLFAQFKPEFELYTLAPGTIPAERDFTSLGTLTDQDTSFNQWLRTEPEEAAPFRLRAHMLVLGPLLVGGRPSIAGAAPVRFGAMGPRSGTPCRGHVFTSKTLSSGDATYISSVAFAHELGHALGLPHTSEEGNLMRADVLFQVRDEGRIPFLKPWQITHVERSIKAAYRQARSLRKRCKRRETRKQRRRCVRRISSFR